MRKERSVFEGLVGHGCGRSDMYMLSQSVDVMNSLHTGVRQAPAGGQSNVPMSIFTIAQRYGLCTERGPLGFTLDSLDDDVTSTATSRAPNTNHILIAERICSLPLLLDMACSFSCFTGREWMSVTVDSQTRLTCQLTACCAWWRRASRGLYTIWIAYGAV